ncbi:hypothetical protein NQZ68_000277 [Dissostichus eleginoides]|nr:hypothetical protein NQZ68_000277 [Dissostichus eleginoides]
MSKAKSLETGESSAVMKAYGSHVSVSVRHVETSLVRPSVRCHGSLYSDTCPAAECMYSRDRQEKEREQLYELHPSIECRCLSVRPIRSACVGRAVLVHYG